MSGQLVYRQKSVAIDGETTTRDPLPPFADSNHAVRDTIPARRRSFDSSSPIDRHGHLLSDDTACEFGFDIRPSDHYLSAPRVAANTAHRGDQLRASSGDGQLKLDTSPRILIVDESADSLEVLGTLLTRQGARVIEARRAEQAVKLAHLYQPDLIVLDRDCDRSPSGTATSDLESAALDRGTPIVMIGTVRQVRERLAPGQFVCKPYHYGPLIDRIEELLAAA